MKYGRCTAFLSSVALLSGCGGGDAGSVNGGTGGGGAGGGGATVTTPPTTVTDQSTCSVRARQDWIAGQMREWYLFPETLPASLDPTPYATPSAFLDALTATARSQRRDRYFTYLTSIQAENAFNTSGASAGFGVRLTSDAAAKRVFIAESFEGAPALAAGIDRGTEILGIGTTANDVRSVTDIITASGTAGVTDALGPSTPGTTRVLQVADAAGTRTVSVTKADYSISPVSTRYGARVLDNGGVKVGYVNLRTFISSADPQLRSAFASFKAQGVTQVIVDLRYNGGGLISIAELMGDLMGANRATTDVFDYTTFRPEKSSENTLRTFSPQPESIAPVRIAFIGTGGSASASELVINAFTPYLRANSALIGANTYGKPVGQIGLDRAQCDDRLRVIAFATQNAARQGDYYDGLATKVEASCQAGDDLTHAFGDPAEASTAQALAFLAGKPCTAIPTGQTGQTGQSASQSARESLARRDLLQPDAPTPAQREVPGSY